MKIEIVFAPQKEKQPDCTLPDVQQRVRNLFGEKGLCCIQDGNMLSIVDKDRENDFSDMWTVLMALLRTDWFPVAVSSCIWHDNNGTQEDVLSQAWKVQGRRIT